MRIDVVERFSPPASRICCYTFAYSPTCPYETLYLGCDNGKIFLIPIPTGQMPHNIRPIDITKESSTQHGADISCLLFSSNKKFTSSQSNGLLFSGSLDRSIKIWSTSGGNTSSPVQTLFGHTSPITKLADGNDGNVLSCSEDGSLRMWSPQRGRNLMLHPFFDCTFSITLGKDVWLTALTVSVLGPWVCYVADSNGNIDVLKKGSEDNEVERHLANFMNQLTKYCRWEKVHSLSISHLEMVKDENILVSLSHDSTCKVLDPATGQVLYQVSNRRRCSYTGAVWVKNITSFYLVDEFGYLEVFNLYHEKVTESVELATEQQTAKQISAVLKCHAHQAIGSISHFSHEGYYLTVVAKNPTIQQPGTTTLSYNSFSASSSTPSSSSSTLGARLKPVGVVGEVVLWNLNNDVNCLEFVGHEGSVVGIAVPVLIGSSSSSSTIDKNNNHNTTAAIVSTATVQQARNVSLNNNKGHSALMTMIKECDESSSNSSVNSISSKSSAAQLRAAVVRSLNISKEEKLFFSAGHEDDTIRCWDEYDRTESYQFRCNRSQSEITVMHAVWQLNRIATGHENGMVCVWNIDTGNKVISRVLKNTVSSLVEASSAHSKLLVGADYSGKIAIWNLTMHCLHPTQLIHVGSDFDGYHSKEDPGILSLAFHSTSKTMFSGGNDCTVRYWRFSSAEGGGAVTSSSSGTATATIAGTAARCHRESISVMKCSESYLLTGDDDGTLCLCRIMFSNNNNNNNNSNTSASSTNILNSYGNNTSHGATSGLPTVTGLSVLCCWTTYPTSMRALGDICELNLTETNNNNNSTTTTTHHQHRPTSSSSRNSQQQQQQQSRNGSGQRILVAQVGAAAGRVKVWEIWTQPRKTVALAARSHRAVVSFEGLIHSTALLRQDLGGGGGTTASSSTALSNSNSNNSLNNSILKQLTIPTSLSSLPHSVSKSPSAAAIPRQGEEKNNSKEDDYEDGGIEAVQGKLKIFESNHPDLYISVSELYSLNHDTKYEVSCCNMFCGAVTGNVDDNNDNTSSVAAMDWRQLDSIRSSILVYLGTTSGVIFRFSFSKK